MVELAGIGGNAVDDLLTIIVIVDESVNELISLDLSGNALTHMLQRLCRAQRTVSSVRALDGRQCRWR